VAIGHFGSLADILPQKARRAAVRDEVAGQRNSRRNSEIERLLPRKAVIRLSSFRAAQNGHKRPLVRLRS
jgi:hypothetical protein